MAGAVFRTLALVALLAVTYGSRHQAASSSSALAKFVLMFSRPGAFNQSAPAFGLPLETSTSCPPGEEGLECRRAEARRLADTCPGGGDCKTCAGCEEANASDWPRCCQHGGYCCYELVAACNSCNITVLQPFCSKHLKRCFESN
ncbi:uncharacterized protein LOC124615814 [Schistocerca americana]|uniref:uncharacterized protein LOC124615814 n=1 Tax=Schistocerca americana TaxID=7009 RepID=UPI001F4FA92E|nr:uncharacterized protein LOC124615814 [Schistocerca americana]XP_047117695.1 uncharacterized protein LOC124798369 [Schistocerca piceifrons]XP_049787915.1 uncharacterized protein LOC126191183 [Schistocerca cancellata]XP_049815112.1 uncharacterized protein LOC126262490 [Schistocerca nitens]XP_049963983.1 uncharacterized protein LOC126484491 [Schistocerca serialis cubense]